MSKHKIQINEIFSHENISIRSFTVCKNNGLKDLKSILNYYKKNKTFINLRNCGNKSNKELITLCIKYIENENAINILPIKENIFTETISIEEIIDYENISIRSYNVCKSNSLRDLKSLLEYYQNNKTFLNLRNCGSKSNEELTNLCLKYIDKENITKLTVPTRENPFVALISTLTRSQREVINSFIESNSNNLSNRSKNAIVSFLKGNLKIRNVSDNILTNDQFSIKDIKNVGTKTTNEIEQFIDSIKVFIEIVGKVENESKLIALKNKFYINKTFLISEIPNEILENLSIFNLVDFLIKNNALFKSHQNIVFQKSVKIYKDQQELTLTQVGKDLNITKERARQIRKNCLDEMFNKLQFIKNIDENLLQKYGIDINQDFIRIDEDLNYSINTLNKTNFSNEFNLFIIFIYISKNFELIGNIEDVLEPKYIKHRNRHNWKNFYLVNRNISKEFDFNALVDDINGRLNERINDTYSFNFLSYLTNFLKTEKKIILPIILSISEKIINQEFELYLDLYETLVFKRNTVKQVTEYAIEVLEKIGIPSKIEVIYNLIQKDYPEITKSVDSLRGSLQRTSEIIYFGRSSTYGLKKWEKEKDNIKGGTIRQIVIEYLENNSSPQHISKIASYVLQFRPNSNEYSIIQNLKLDESETFIFYKNSIIGLSQKIYEDKYILSDGSKINEKKTWEERFDELTDFLNANNRLPFSSGCPDTELILNRWYKIQVRKIKKIALDDKKCSLIKEVINKFEKETLQKRKVNDIEKYNKLKQFIIENRRLPSANKMGEESLYKFFYKQRTKFNQGCLKKEEECIFIEIAKIIQTNKYESRRK
ncbi:hypothetical protein DR864_09505 [Runella rosea]|uniref:RNA polymerase sigma-70 region 4 domain-containing protein n=1 Tax=Runella rosea TaxID=2259595 RepID=A0A344TH32_9BACT|nr:hypothetical protein [Runella rosea]AXE17953.1 hypothetical protein DR864_09505 [Runella rosea]